MSMSLGSDTKSNAMNHSIFTAADGKLLCDDRKCWQDPKDPGVLSVVAGGNDNDLACKQTPAHVPRAFVVGATGTGHKTQWGPGDNKAWYSNYGDCTDIWAPGDRVISCKHDSNTAFRPMSGTSMATPAVSGAAALMLQANPTMKADEVAKQLSKYATPDIVKGSNLGKNLHLFVTDYTTSTTTRAPSRGRRRTTRRRTVRRRSPRRRSKTPDKGDQETSTRRRRRGSSSGSPKARRRRRRSDSPKTRRRRR